ncbi:hypothetical protein BJ875DRAFT_212245 [Amylocarpus encephaloides]|uniref:DUF4045 domain-containing protein n=1 Tax=Amylocarpus encephaloides TaxID=45428 RepID=A0A9P7YN57_9HELO|nr:hypothetical protein BJ875DRAFT_212245 [Amylocarpus encephaloides]
MSVADSSEDVIDFLQRIKELGHKRDEEDDERARKLEQEILEGRKQRQARRSERARSISPTKSSPANTPTASKVSLGLPSASSSQDLSASHDPQSCTDTAIENTMDSAVPTSSATKQSYAAGGDARTSGSNYKLNDPPKISPSSAMPSRSSPLSWQRRPTSQSSDHTRSRPLSMVATENAARSPKAQSPEASPATAEPVLSRDQISQSLASQDQPRFRQTADRGMNSPAYRRNQAEDGERSDQGQGSARVKLPGMSGESPPSLRTAEEPMDRSSSLSSSSAAVGNTMRESYHALPATAGRVGSPQVPLTGALRLDPPNSTAQSENRGMAMSPSQGRISPERLDRPLSPTKGMGGFVQSAMMKRSDSVNKRWSVQSPPGLNRANSVASNRSNHDAGTGNTLGAASHLPTVYSSLSRESSPRPPSRPTSSHSTVTAPQDGPTASSIDDEGFVKPALPTSRSQTPQTTKEGSNEPSPAIDTTSRVDATPPTSPSKTMDPRRWSPTKSSWLETALNKPESPKPKSVPHPQQPSWMSEINKAKQKGSADLGRGPVANIKHEVAIGGLMRTPPPGRLSKPPGTGGLPSGFSSAALSKGRPESGSSQGSEDTAKQSDLGEASSQASRIPPATTKVKPETPPKKDFRSTLKPRQIPTENSGSAEPEFKNVFGQLRRTKTQNYVAPDELKNNITRGKAALNLTGGPKKTERTDGFKEAILKKKEDFKKTQIEGKGVRPTSGTNKENDVPEALARRRAMSRVEPSSSLDASPTHRTEPSKSSGMGKESMAVGGGKLASRFNPVLAGLLARGPPSMTSDASRSSSPANSTTSQRAVGMITTTDPQEPGPQLTHMTKSRARGPRRKAPSAAPSTPGADPAKPEPEAISVSDTANLEKSKSAPQPVKPLKPVQNISQPDSVSPTKEVATSQPSSPRKLDMKRRSQFLQEGPDKFNGIETQSSQL